MRKFSFFKIYTGFIISLTGIALLSFAVGAILEIFNSSSNLDTIISIAHSIVEITGSVLAIFCTIHILVILIRSVLPKSEHSFIWFLFHQAFPLVVPLISFVFIRIFWGAEIFDIMELLCGILAGLVSSILVLIMDRRHNLAEEVLRFVAPEYSENNRKNTQN